MSSTTFTRADEHRLTALREKREEALRSAGSVGVPHTPPSAISPVHSRQPSIQSPSTAAPLFNIDVALFSPDEMAELAALEAKYDVFIKEGLENMRANAMRDENTMSKRLRGRGNLVKAVGDRVKGLWDGIGTQLSGRRGSASAVPLDGLAAQQPSMQPSQVQEQNRLALICGLVSMIVSVIAVQQLKTLSAVGDMDTWVTSSFAMAHLVTGVVGLSCVSAWMLRCAVPIRKLLVAGLCLLALTNMVRERHVVRFTAPSAFLIPPGSEQPLDADSSSSSSSPSSAAPQRLIESDRHRFDHFPASQFDTIPSHHLAALCGGDGVLFFLGVRLWQAAATLGVSRARATAMEETLL